MDPQLEKQILENLQRNTASPQPISYEDQLSNLVEQMQKHSINTKLESAFMQVMGKTDQTEQTSPDDFEQKQSLKSVMSGSMLKKAFGASIAGQIGGIISGFLPINLGLQGVPSVLGGLAINRFAKGKTGSDISEGVIIGGLSLTIAGLMGGSLNLGGLLGRSSATSTNGTAAGNVIF